MSPAYATVTAFWKHFQNSAVATNSIAGSQICTTFKLLVIPRTLPLFITGDANLLAIGGFRCRRVVQKGQTGSGLVHALCKRQYSLAMPFVVTRSCITAGYKESTEAKDWQE